MATLANPIVKFKSLEGHYTADACVVWCYDDRFYRLLKAFGKKQGFKNIDLVKIAGGAKALAGDASTDRDFVINQVKTSVRLHGTRRVILMLHRDCGAYGGSKSFESLEAEREHFTGQLNAARAFVKNEIPAVPVDAYFADFDGLYQE